MQKCLFNWEPCQEAINASELYADHLISIGELGISHEQVTRLHDEIWADANEQRWFYIRERATAAVRALSQSQFDEKVILSVFNHGLDYQGFATDSDEYGAKSREQKVQAALLRDIFGNPFRPVSFDPDWRTSTAVALATQMYDSRDFSAMPILADALQDAGCASSDILDHCRGPGPHVRGCWVVDLVLGKE